MKNLNRKLRMLDAVRKLGTVAHGLTPVKAGTRTLVDTVVWGPPPIPMQGGL